MIRRVVLIVTYVFICLATSAGEYFWQNISLDQGLSHCNVTSITRDQHGFVWIGTRFGLNRYDFENVVNYYHDPSDPNTIPHNTIRSLYSDTRGNLWVACESGVAVKGKDNSFKQLFYKGSTVNARSFYEETDGLLLGGSGKIYYYDYATETLTPLQTRGGSDVYYTSILQRGNDTYILSTRWDGLWLFDRAHATITRLPGERSPQIMTCTIDSHGLLWVSPYGEGIAAYDHAGTQVYSFTTSDSALGSNIVLDVAEFDKKIWIATDGGGVAIFDPETGTLERRSSRTSTGEISSVTTLYTDQNGNLYAGIVRDGIASVKPVAMHTYHSSRHPLSTIASIWQDKDGKIWLGDDGEGIIKYDPDFESIERVPPTAGLKVTEITDHDPNNLLIATFDKGFFLMNKNSGQLSPAPPELQAFWEKRSIRAFAVHLRRINNDKLAIITDEITIYDPVSRKILTTCNKPQGVTGVITPFYNIGGRLLCYSTNCITEYDPVTDIHSCLLRLDPYVEIQCAAYDGSNTIFIGSENGVRAYDISSGKITLLPDINEPASALACQGDERLYIATTRSLYLKNRATGNIVGFGVNDGVMPNEYMPNATYVSEKCILFGGVYGLLRIHPSEVDAILTTQSEPFVSVSEIKVDGVDVSSHISEGRLVIPDYYSAITLSVIDNGSNSQRRQRFRYIIKGDGADKVIETFARTIDLNFLQSGIDYDVAVSCLRPDGAWTREASLLTIGVSEQWWHSKWFWIIVILTITTSMIFYEVNRNNRRKALMTAQMDHYRRNTLEKELAFFVNTNYALRTPLTLIYAPVKLLLEQLESDKHADIMPALEVIYRNTKKMRDTIDMALELHQVNDKPHDTGLATHDVNRSVNNAILAMKQDFELKNISLKYTPHQEIFPAIYDRDRIHTVIETLLRSAIQRSTDHSAIEIQTELIDNYVRVSVSDSGEHLDDETLSGLFSKYFHDENSKFGNSLGFAYVRNIIDLLGGRTGADNNGDGPGITVWFEFPIAGRQDAETYLSRRKNEIGQPALDSGETILADVNTSALTAIVAEEDNDLAMFIADHLSNHFGRVLHAFNGKDALVLIQQYQPDIVISSLMLPVMSGIELCRAIKRSPETSHIPVILLTALKDDPQLTDAYGAGADSYLSKPFDLNVLMTRCRNILHTHSVMKRRYGSATTVKSTERQISNADETFMLKIDKIIARNLSNPNFTVETIVETMSYSRSALYTRFKEITGKSIGSYIAESRLRKAKELLQDPSLSINEISDMVGFSSQRYFSTFFKDHTGMSPTAYRQHTNKND